MKLQQCHNFSQQPCLMFYLSNDLNTATNSDNEISQVRYLTGKGFIFGEPMASCWDVKHGILVSILLSNQRQGCLILFALETFQMIIDCVEKGCNVFVDIFYYLHSGILFELFYLQF